MSPHPEKPDQNLPNNLGIAYRLGADFISGILVGLLIGYFVDKGLGTSPWGMVVFIVLGMGAGLLNVIRSYNQISQSERQDKKGDNTHE